MCGFLGKISFNEINKNLLEDGNKFTVCRGPDECKRLFGKFESIFDNSDNLNFDFIFNRLSILDLSDKGSQPMIYKSNQCISMFNGEIFNHKELRAELESKGIKFNSSHSDSEVVLKGLSTYGLDYVKKLRGQFAIAFYNSSLKKLYLIRDRLGQKPLYYIANKHSISFASNLKSLISIEQDVNIKEKSLIEYLSYGIVPSPNTLFENYYKIEPGQILEIKLVKDNILLNQHKYWDPIDFLDNKKFNKNLLFDLIDESTNIRNKADVDIAYFLSGGIDSTSIIKSAIKENKTINSYSIIYDDKKYDESIYINEVSEKYKTNHTNKKLSNSDISKIINETISALDEPYADPSIIPTYAMCKEISKSYKVAISGDGGDEAFGGYTRFQKSIGRKRNLRFLASLFNIYPYIFGTGNIFLRNSKNIIHSYSSFLVDKKLIKALGFKVPTTMESTIIPKNLNEINTIYLSDYYFFLSEMMLFKIDRMSMANSLEVRSPFLDNKLVEYMLSVNKNFLVSRNPKKVLKSRLIEDFSSVFINRKKMGFVFNVEEWVFANKKLIDSEVERLNLLKNDFKRVIKKLSYYKSKTNGLRIWKLYILAKYINNLDN